MFPKSPVQICPAVLLMIGLVFMKTFNASMYMHFILFFVEGNLIIHWVVYQPFL